MTKIASTAHTDLWGAAEVAAHLGVKQSNLRQLSGLPAPVQKIAATSLWLPDDIRKFKKQRARRHRKSVAA